MSGIIKTHIYCYDDHRGFAEEVKKRFADQSKYYVASYQTREEFIARLESDKLFKFCKVAMLGLHDTQDQFDMIEKLTKEVKRIDQHTGLILLGPSERMESIKRTIKFNIDAYIPKNRNLILRTHNSVKKLISEHSINLLRKRSRISFFALIGFLLLTCCILIAAYFKLPMYF